MDTKCYFSRVANTAAVAVLKALCRKFTFENNKSVSQVVAEAIRHVPLGLSGADMSAVASGASNLAMLRRVEEVER